jgi:hypothetical protein
MDCVYHAFKDYLYYLDEKPFKTDYLYYRTLKWFMQGSRPQYTFGGITPWIIDRLSSYHGHYIYTEYRVYTPDHYIEVADKYYPAHSWRMRMIMNLTRWHEVETIRLHPAIFLLLTGQHAIFSTKVPDYGTPIMSIQIRR